MGIEELDKALTYLYPKYNLYETHDTLKSGCFNNSNEIDVEAIIIQLQKDEYLHYGIGETNKYQFKLSIAGRLAYETGGYIGQRKRLLNQTCIQSLEKWLIVFGTVAAGLYGIVELLKKLF